MSSRMLCAVSLAAVMAGAALSASPAAAAEPKKHVVTDQNGRVVAAKPKTRITVEKRSFLDAGTDVLPGQRKYLDYAFPPGYSPTGVIDHTSANIYGPLIDPLAVPGHYSPIFLGW
jgi:hypothetical protein